MKAPLVFGSFLALAGTAIAAERADAAVSDLDIANNALRDAICEQDWYKAIELSGQLMISPKVLPEHRQKLVEWRRHFYTSLKSRTRTDKVPSCEQLWLSSPEEFQQQTYSGPIPRFSSISSLSSSSFVSESPLVSESVSNDVVSQPLNQDLSENLWTVGVRVDGNRIRGKLLNNGWNSFRNVKLTIRSQKIGRSTNVKTVALGQVRAWSETEFVAAFAESPKDWIIEKIEVN